METTITNLTNKNEELELKSNKVDLNMMNGIDAKELAVPASLLEEVRNVIDGLQEEDNAEYDDLQLTNQFIEANNMFCGTMMEIFSLTQQAEGVVELFNKFGDELQRTSKEVRSRVETGMKPTSALGVEKL